MVLGVFSIGKKMLPKLDISAFSICCILEIFGVNAHHYDMRKRGNDIMFGAIAKIGQVFYWYS